MERDALALELVAQSSFVAFREVAALVLKICREILISGPYYVAYSFCIHCIYSLLFPGLDKL